MYICWYINIYWYICEKFKTIKDAAAVNPGVKSKDGKWECDDHKNEAVMNNNTMWRDVAFSFRNKSCDDASSMKSSWRSTCIPCQHYYIVQLQILFTSPFNQNKWRILKISSMLHLVYIYKRVKKELPTLWMLEVFWIGRNIENFEIWFWIMGLVEK